MFQVTVELIDETVADTQFCLLPKEKDDCFNTCFLLIAASRQHDSHSDMIIFLNKRVSGQQSEDEHVATA